MSLQVLRFTFVVFVTFVDKYSAIELRLTLAASEQELVESTTGIQIPLTALSVR
jgi:hypothetical protein